MNPITPAQFAINWWKGRHSEPHGYFPNMEQHKNWKLYEEMPGWFLELADLVKDDTALEIGCGYGQWMAPLSQMIKRVDGFDIHESLLKKFVEQLGQVKSVRMRLGDGLTVPFTEHYSLIYSISVFQHMPREIVKGYIREASDLLLPDGRCVFHFRHADNDGPYSQDIAVDHTGDWSVGWTEQEATEACEAVGLKVVKAITGGNSLIVRAVHP